MLFLLYDSIDNSVFYSQVLVPLIHLLDEQKNLKITLISFEKRVFSFEKVQQLIPRHQRLEVVLSKKPLFLGKITLWWCTKKLKKLLKKIPVTRIMARGPLAGWVALGAAPREVSVTVQARGLMAEEFRYVMERRRGRGVRAWVKRMLKNFLYRWYKKIEREVYGCKRDNFMIESVSPALKKYLEEHFGASPDQVRVASYDIPSHFSHEQVAQWRREVRDWLGIPHNYYIFCYMGSARPWQCVDEMIDYFFAQYKRNKKIFFLILSQDKELFERKIKNRGISKKNYFVMSIKPDETYRYLSAADAGLLFREKDPVNWVSRPTKMLEYQAVGLKIIHNDTVAWLRVKNI